VDTVEAPVPTAYPTLHAVVRCALDRPELDCKATAFRGPPSRTFYVSPDAVYIWTASEQPGAERAASALVYRLPLDGSPVTGLRARGMPIDQFSFQQAGGKLNVLVQGAGSGDAMWAAEGQSGAPLALMRAPLTAFTKEIGELGPQAFQGLPRPKAWSLQNRFVGEHLLWGAGSGWRSEGGDD